jgi:hypothetical protein
MAFTKPRRELEPRWVSEYLATTFPKAEVRMAVPLGGIPKETQANYGLMKGLRVYRPWRPEVDGAVRLAHMTVLVEAKIFKYMDGLSKLPVYKALVPSTPELAHWPTDINMELLIPAPITWVQQAAVQSGVKVIHTFVPEYIKQAWEERDKYWTKENMALREERKKKLQELGMT